MKMLYAIFAASFVLGSSVAAKLATKYLPPGRYFFNNPSRHENQYLASRSSSRSHLYSSSTVNRLDHSNVYATHFGQNNAAAAQVPILRQGYNNDAKGNYNFDFETGDGTRRNEIGQFKGGWPHGSQSVSGSYSYTGDDGHIYTVNYKADGNGFQATGDHLPTPPPVPREIQESLALHHDGRATQTAAAHHSSGAASFVGGFRAASRPQSPPARYLPPQH